MVVKQPQVKVTCVRNCQLLLFITVFLLACATHATYAQTTYGRWTSSKIGGGGYLQHIVFCPSDPNRIYLSSDVGGMFRSDDKGRTWRMIHGSLPPRESSYSLRGLLVDPTDANRLLCAVGLNWDEPQGIYLSEDGGQTWQQTLKNKWFLGNGATRSAGHVLVRSPSDRNRILAASVDTGLFISMDNGATWKPSAMEHLQPTDLLMDQTNPQTVWLCSMATEKMGTQKGPMTLLGGLFVSHDGGEHFEKLSEIAPLEMVQHPKQPRMLIGLFRDQQVQFSMDGGLSFKPLTEGLPQAGKGYRDPGTFRAITTGPDFVLLGSTHGEVYRLDEDAQKWLEIKPQSVNEGDWFARMQEGVHQHYGSAMGYIAVSPHNPNHWAFTDWYAYYQSFDAGKNWQLAIDGIEMTVIHCLRQDFGNAHLTHMGMADNGYFQSDNDGKTFNWIHKGIPGNIKDIALNPTMPALIYATGPKAYQWMANQVYISENSGKTWQKSPMTGVPNLDKERCNSITVNPQNPREVYIALSGKIGPDGGGPYRSNDGGKTWQWLGQGLPQDKHFFANSIWVIGRELQAGPDGHLLAVSNAGKCVYRFDRATGQWQRTLTHLDAQPHDMAADLNHPGRFYVAVKYDGLYRTDDGGVTWNKVYDGSTTFVTVDTNVKNRIAISTHTDVLLSLDAGEHWQSIGSQIPSRSHRMPLTFSANSLLVGTGGSGVFHTHLDAPPPAKTAP